jgi:hypothetical protein
MRHMVANFYSHFKNKDLMNLFKRIYNQNQEQKFNALWKVLDDLSTKNAHVPESSSRLFTCWIRDSSKEKWELLYDNGVSRYGIMTTNLADLYNMLMCGVRILPLVGIIEFIFYWCMHYFMKHHAAASLALMNEALVY